MSSSVIGDLPVRLPPLETQRAIADFLDRETERIDLLVEKKKRLIELLEEKRTALISHAVTKGLDPTVPMKDSGIPWLGEIPAHWEVAPIRRTAQYVNSNVDKKTSPDEIPVRLCNYTDVYNGSYLDSTGGFMEATATPEEIRRFRLRAGTVIITKDSESADDIGVPAYVSTRLDAVCGYHLTVLTPKADLMRGDFLFWALSSSGLRACFEVASNGVTRFGLTREGMGGASVPVPPIAEQRQIASRLRIEDIRLNSVSLSIGLQLEKLAEYRQALITAAVTGQIDVTEARPDPEEVVA